MTETSRHNKYLLNIFNHLKEGDTYQPPGCEKIFKKRGGLIVSPDIEAYEWMKSNVGNEFTNKYVVRILYAFPKNFIPINDKLIPSSRSKTIRVNNM